MAANGARNVYKTVGKVNRVLVPQLQNIRDSRIGKPLYHVYVDYKNVFLELCSFAYKRPFRAGFNMSIAGAFAGVWLNNPDEDSYTVQFMENANTLLLLGDKIRNPTSTGYVERIMKLHSENRLKRYNLGLFSVIIEQEYSDTSCYYEARCYYFKQRWIYMYNNIVDIGFLRKWYFLDKAMVNYDINDVELSKLPNY